MRYRVVHLVDVSTVETLTERKNGSSWRSVATALGYPASYAATLHAVYRRKPGAITRTGETELRKRLGLAPVVRKRYHRPCLDEAEWADYLQWRAAREAA